MTGYDPRRCMHGGSSLTSDKNHPPKGISTTLSDGLEGILGLALGGKGLRGGFIRARPSEGRHY
jgi:hypothetical protein